MAIIIPHATHIAGLAATPAPGIQDTHTMLPATAKAGLLLTAFNAVLSAFLPPLDPMTSFASSAGSAAETGDKMRLAERILSPI